MSLLHTGTGAGSAKLSYVLIQKLLKLAKYLPRRGVKSDGNSNVAGQESGGFCFKYVITDFSHANFGFWLNHPRLQELFALGIIDFAVFDAEAERGNLGGRPSSAGGQGDNDEEHGEVGEGDDGSSSGGVDANGEARGIGLWGSGCLRLELSGEELRPGDLEHPVVVVANYVFDSLKQDAFRCGADTIMSWRAKDCSFVWFLVTSGSLGLALYLHFDFQMVKWNDFQSVGVLASMSKRDDVSRVT